MLTRREDKYTSAPPRCTCLPTRQHCTEVALGGEQVQSFFQALRCWKILFSPSDFEPTSVRNCQFLTQPVRNCQHADPYQVLGLERSEQQCVLDTRRHQPTPTRCWGLNNLPEDFSNMNCFHFTRCAENLAYSKEWGSLSRQRLFSPKA